MRWVCEYVANESRKGANRGLSRERICRSVHLREEYDSDQRADRPTDRSKPRVMET
jgi:hypothetical protein